MELVDNSGNVITDVQLRELYPYVSFAANLTQIDVEPYGYSIVQSVTPPSPLPFYNIVEGQPVLVGGVWTQTWTQTAIPLAQAQAQQSGNLSSACASAIVAGFTSAALGATYTYPSKVTDQGNMAASILESQLVSLSPSWVAGESVVQSSSGVPCTTINANGLTYMCTQSGITGGTAPTWPTTPGTPVNDGTAVWQMWTTEFWCADSNGNWAWTPHTVSQIQMVGRTGKATIMAYQEQNAVLQSQVNAATTVDAVAAIGWPT